MKFVIQRVKHASVKVDNQIKGAIEKGFLVFIGVSQEDNQEIADKMIKKMIQLRIFEDENGKTNLSLADVNGQLLLISQFTLYADCKKGNRPSFVRAGKPDMANELYEYVISQCKIVRSYHHVKWHSHEQTLIGRRNICNEWFTFSFGSTIR